MSGEDELMGANVSQREDASDSSAQEGRLKDGRRHAKLEKALSRGRIPPILNMFSSPIKVQEIKDFVEENPNCIHDIDEEGKDTVIHRLIERIQEDDAEQKHLLDYILEKEIDITQKNVAGDTPLHIAAKCNKYKTMKLLIQKLSNSKNVILNERNNDGCTCLHVAVQYCSVEVVAILHSYAHWLDETTKNKQGFTAQEVAEKIQIYDHRNAMEKISEILQTDVDTFVNEKLYLNYLKEISNDDLWSLRPIFNTNVHGGNPIIGQNNTVNIKCNCPDAPADNSATSQSSSHLQEMSEEKPNESL